MIIKGNEFYVETPQGMRPHGFIKDNKFCRRVKEKDRMQIFDAWSINPEVMSNIFLNPEVDTIHYKDEDHDYKISIEDAMVHGFEKTFSGGTTRYIPIKFWDKQLKKQQTLL